MLTLVARMSQSRSLQFAWWILRIEQMMVKFSVLAHVGPTRNWLRSSTAKNVMAQKPLAVTSLVQPTLLTYTVENQV